MKTYKVTLTVERDDELLVIARGLAKAIETNQMELQSQATNDYKQMLRDEIKVFEKYRDRLRVIYINSPF